MPALIGVCGHICKIGAYTGQNMEPLSLSVIVSFRFQQLDISREMPLKPVAATIGRVHRE